MWNKSCLVPNLIAIPCLIAIVGTAAFAQRAVPPPPKPADSGPSLAVTMQFIQEKLIGLGTVNYATYVHDNIVGNNWGDQFSVQATNIIADPATCRVTYHWKSTRNGSVTSDIDAFFSLHDVVDIVVTSLEQNMKQLNTAAGHPSYDVKADPPVFVLEAQRSGNVMNVFDFTDEDMANRVAKAMVHAVELCGGGNKEPF